MSTTEAARRKGVSRQAILGAISRGAIDGKKVSVRSVVVLVNERFLNWEPNRMRQLAGRSRKRR